MTRKLETRNSVKCAKLRLDLEPKRTTNKREVFNQMMIARKMERTKRKAMKTESTKMKMKTKKVTITSDIIWFV